MSSPKSPKEIGGADLSIRARRFGLSPDEQRGFERACMASPVLHVSHLVGCAFDRLSDVRAGDDELISRVADRVLAPPSGQGRLLRRERLGWAFGVAVALVSSGAAAWWTGSLRPHAAVPVVQSTPGDHGGLSGEPRARRAAVRASEPPELDESPGIEHGPPLSAHVPSSTATRVRRAGNGSAPPEVVSAPSETAADLFRRANAARHIGDFAGAAAQYAELEARFPGSDEAQLSHVSLGKLLLASGRALDAEQQFSLYLSEGGRALAEEALLGRAECLERLGRVTEERRSWQRLLRDFPGSVYGVRATHRLEELDPHAP